MHDPSNLAQWLLTTRKNVTQNLPKTNWPSDRVHSLSGCWLSPAPGQVVMDLWNAPWWGCGCCCWAGMPCHCCGSQSIRLWETPCSSHQRSQTCNLCSVTSHHCTLCRKKSLKDFVVCVWAHLVQKHPFLHSSGQLSLHLFVFLF